jgi:exopolyphosphatase/guanosine-5'-triphosphate,3'-diphosphate pyrophosphatase
MRLGVLDVGSNTVHLLVVDAHQGGRPLPAFSHKAELRIGEHLDADNRLTDECAQRLREFVHEALQIAEDKGVEMLAFATSARPGRGQRPGGARPDRGRDRRPHPGAARRGRGQADLPGRSPLVRLVLGRLLVLDIGGGSLEIASGLDEEPEARMSLPLGAGRLTRDWLTADPPPADEVRALRKHVRAEIARLVGTLRRAAPSTTRSATSKTFRQLARIAGAAPSSEGFYVRRSLKHTDVACWAERLAAMDRRRAARLPGVSEGRARRCRPARSSRTR